MTFWYKKSQSWWTHTYVYLLTHKIIYVQTSYRWSYNAVYKGLITFTEKKGMTPSQMVFLFRRLMLCFQFTCLFLEYF